MRTPALLVALALAGPLAAQGDPRLVTAVRLAQDGLPDSARAVAGRLLAATQPTDSLYPEALFTVGLLAATEQDRRLYLRRVVADYALSAWADDALLHLGQLDYAGGNAESAVRQFDQLLRDYPASPLLAQAAFWGARAAADRRDPTAACRMADAGLAVVGSDVELRNQLEFQKQRCASLASLAAESARAAAAADSAARARPTRPPATRPAPAPAPPPAPAPTPEGAPAPGFYVQVSAVTTDAAAASETARLKRAGFTPVITREGGFQKIRLGPHPTRPEAVAAAARVRARLGGAPFVVRVP